MQERSIPISRTLDEGQRTAVRELLGWLLWAPAEARPALIAGWATAWPEPWRGEVAEHLLNLEGGRRG